MLEYLLDSEEIQNNELWKMMKFDFITRIKRSKMIETTINDIAISESESILRMIEQLIHGYLLIILEEIKTHHAKMPNTALRFVS